MVLIYNNVILLTGVSIFMFCFEKIIFEWSRTQSGGNETAEYSYFHDGCQLQCVLLLMCQYVIARAWRRSLCLLLAEQYVIQYLNSNSQMDRGGLVLDSKLYHHFCLTDIHVILFSY